MEMSCGRIIEGNYERDIAKHTGENPLQLIRRKQRSFQAMCDIIDKIRSELHACSVGGNSDGTRRCTQV